MYIIREMIESLDYLKCYYNNELKKDIFLNIKSFKFNIFF